MVFAYLSFSCLAMTCCKSKDLVSEHQHKTSIFTHSCGNVLHYVDPGSVICLGKLGMKEAVLTRHDRQTNLLLSFTPTCNFFGWVFVLL